MKKTLVMALLVLFWTVSVAGAAALKVGDKLPPFSLPNAEGKMYTADTPPFAGHLLLISYVVKKDEKFSAQLAAAKPKIASVGIINLKDISVPNFVLKKAIKKEEEKTKTPILLDDKYTLVNAWGLNKKAYNLILVDKSRIVRYIYRAPASEIPAAETTKLISVIKAYENK